MSGDLAQEVVNSTPVSAAAPLGGAFGTIGEASRTGLVPSTLAIRELKTTARLGMVAFLIPATLIGFVGIDPAVVFHEGSTLVANALRLLAYRKRGTTTAAPTNVP